MNILDVIKQSIYEVDVCTGFCTEDQLDGIGTVTAAGGVFRQARHDLPPGATNPGIRRFAKSIVQSYVVDFRDQPLQLMANLSPPHCIQRFCEGLASGDVRIER